MDEIGQLLTWARGSEKLDIQSISQSSLLLGVEMAADGPAAVEVFVRLASQANDDSALDGAIRLIERTGDPGVLAEIVDFLARGMPLTNIAARAFWAVFLRRSEDRNSSYGVRSHALHGALFLSQERQSLLLKLQGSLLDLDVDDDPQFLRHAARILGTILAHDSKNALREKLESLVSIDEAKDEVAMALGLDALRTGLGSSGTEEARESFQASLVYFENAVSASEERVDAKLFRECVAMLLDVQDQGFDGNLAHRVSSLQALAFQYAGFLLLDDRPNGALSWIGNSSSEQLHWTMLGLRIGAMDGSLTKKVWTNVGKVLEEELFTIYRASQSIFLRGHISGIDRILRPRIVDALMRRRRHLDELEQWIEENADSPSLPNAEAMLMAVAEAQKRSIHHVASSEADEDEDIFAILDAGEVVGTERAAALARLEKIKWMLKLDENPIVAKMESALTKEMANRNKNFLEFPDAKVLFAAVLHYSLCFLIFRHNTSRATDATAGYLFIRKPKVLPHESDVQQDYYRYLSGSPLRDVVQVEARDIGSGRADVYFTYRGVTMVTEVKRSEQDCDHPQLLEAYGAQTAAYQSTNVTFGFLLVLDLFDRHGGQPHVEEQISLNRKELPGQNTAYDIVVMRVQGQRLPPSKQR